MSLVIVTARVHADNVDAVAVEARRTFAAIAAAAPDAGYAVCKGPDGTFVAILDAPEGSNPLLAIPAFVDFQDGISAWGAEPPTSELWEVVGSYRLFERTADSAEPERLTGSLSLERRTSNSSAAANRRTNQEHDPRRA